MAVMKCVFNMTKRERNAIARKFLELHQSHTARCEIDYIVDDNGIEFFPKEGDTFHPIEKVVKFAEYYNSSAYATYDNIKNKVVLRVI